MLLIEISTSGYEEFDNKENWFRGVDDFYKRNKIPRGTRYVDDYERYGEDTVAFYGDDMKVQVARWQDGKGIILSDEQFNKTRKKAKTDMIANIRRRVFGDEKNS